MGKTSIILDVDTGVDDAFAVLFAALHPDINLLGITCVDGNTNIDQVVANTLKVLDAAGAPDIPVARGAVKPLLGKSQYAEYVHGADGMGDLGITPSARKVDSRSAVELLRDLIEQSKEPVTIVPFDRTIKGTCNDCSFSTAHKHRIVPARFSGNSQESSPNCFDGWLSFSRQCNSRGRI